MMHDGGRSNFFEIFLKKHLTLQAFCDILIEHSVLV